MKNASNVLGGSLLIAGVAIGAGMLGLPVKTAQAGFIPTVLVFLFFWLFMVATGLLFLEASLWFERGSNFLSMAELTLGKGMRFFTWFVYLFLFYSLSIAYISGAGEIFSNLSLQHLNPWQGSLIFVVCLSPAVYLGAKVVDRLNAFFMLGLILSFCFFVVFGLPYVKVENLNHYSWSASTKAFPIAFTSFGFQGLIPTLLAYMDRDPHKVRLSIFIGSFIPFCIYLLWEFLILTIVPLQGPGGLLETLNEGATAVKPLLNITNQKSLFFVGQFFGFCALVTSFLGVTLPLLDFLADGLKIKKHRRGRLFLSSLVFLPPILISRFHSGIFLTALDYAGAYGATFLLGILPVMIVWSGRYFQNRAFHPLVPGGRVSLIILFALSFCVILSKLT